MGSKVSEDYNALPFEVRKIAGRVITQRQLLDYQIERKRAVAAHKRHLAEIDSHIKNIKEAIRRDV